MKVMKKKKKLRHRGEVDVYMTQHSREEKKQGRNMTLLVTHKPHSVVFG